jgi:hypothetical protein
MAQTGAPRFLDEAGSRRRPATRQIARLSRHEAFAAHLAPLRRKNWFVYAKPPFSGPEAVLAKLHHSVERAAEHRPPTADPRLRRA